MKFLSESKLVVMHIPASSKKVHHISHVIPLHEIPASTFACSEKHMMNGAHIFKDNKTFYIKHHTCIDIDIFTCMCVCVCVC